MISEVENIHWKKNSPYFTIVVPVYNRKNIVMRTIDSLNNQTFKDFELIIVDDGSNDDIDSVILPFIDKTKIPTKYIKKKNGGVHTARNIGTKYARGKILYFLDSDDEILPKTLETVHNVWENIVDKSQYREIVALCIDEKGNNVGDDFPENINALPLGESMKVCNSLNAEHVGFYVTDIMKKNLWPEPDGVTFVREGILWRKLNKEYNSYFLNERLRVYHLDGTDHLTGKKSVFENEQKLKNMYWDNFFIINNKKIYIDNYIHYIKSMIMYILLDHFIKDKKFKNKYKLCNLFDKIMRLLFLLPSLMLIPIFKKKYM